MDEMFSPFNLGHYSGLYLRLLRILSNAFLYILGRESILEEIQGQKNPPSIYLPLSGPKLRWRRSGGMEVQRDRERKTFKFFTNLISKCIGNKNKCFIRIDILFASRLKLIVIVCESLVRQQRFSSTSCPFPGIAKGMKGNSRALDNKSGKPWLNLFCKEVKSLPMGACDPVWLWGTFSSGLLLVSRYVPIGGIT